MTKRAIWLIAVLVIGLTFSAAAQPTFDDLNYDARHLNPRDSGIIVQKIEITNSSTHDIQIDQLTIQNLGTATDQEIQTVSVGYSQTTSLTLTGTELDGIQWGITRDLGQDDSPPYPIEISSGGSKTVWAQLGLKGASSIDGGETVRFGIRFHYLTLDNNGDAIAADSSDLITDGTGETIKRAGFEDYSDETITASEIDYDVVQPGDPMTVQKITLTEDDANQRRVQLKKGIAVKNQGTATNQDIQTVSWELTYNDNDTIQTGSTAATDFQDSWVSLANISKGFTDAQSDSSHLPATLTVKVTVSNSADPSTTVNTAVKFETKELNPTTPTDTFTSVVPSTKTFGVEPYSIEIIEDVTDPDKYPSGVINPGNSFTQTVKVTDQDANGDPVDIESIEIKNLGTAPSDYIQTLSVTKSGTDGTTWAISSPNFGAKQTPSSSAFSVTDDGTINLDITYTIANSIQTNGNTIGKTIKPRIKLSGTEKSNSASSEFTTPDFDIKVLGPGLEDINSLINQDGTIFPGQPRVVQSVECVDRDENSHDAFLNPIVVKNQGTTPGSNLEKIQLKTGQGEVIATVDDPQALEGFGGPGVTFSDLSNKTPDTTIEDKPSGNTRIIEVCITLKQSSKIDSTTYIELKTTLYASEGPRNIAHHQQGRKFTISDDKPPTVSITKPTADQFEYKDTVTFQADASDPDGPTPAVEWTFDAPGTSIGSETGTKVTKTFSEVTGKSEIQVTATATDTEGLSASDSITITILGKPKASYSYSPSNPQAGDEVTFTDESEPSSLITSRTWTLPDGSTQTGSQVSYTFSDADTYTVSLKVTDTYGNTDSVEKDITIGHPPLTADFSYSPRQPEVGQTVRFTNTSVPEETIEEYTWYFYDDSSPSFNANPTHSYESAGTYTVSLIVDAGQKEEEERKTITVVSGGQQPQPEQPTASFTYDPDQPVVGETITFESTSTPPQGGSIATTTWDLGDGTEKTGSTVTYSYSQADAYTVTLTVEAGNGKTDSVSKDITVAVAASYKQVVAGKIPDVPSGVSDPSLYVGKKELQYANWLYVSGTKPQGLTEAMTKKELNEITALYITGESITSGQSTQVSTSQITTTLQSIGKFNLGSPSLGNSFKLQQVQCAARPTRDPSEVSFSAEASSSVVSSRVQVYDLSGAPVFDSGWRRGSEINWNLDGSISSGVYIYVLQVRSSTGSVDISKQKVLLIEE